MIKDSQRLNVCKWLATEGFVLIQKASQCGPSEPSTSLVLIIYSISFKDCFNHASIAFSKFLSNSNKGSPCSLPL